MCRTERTLQTIWRSRASNLPTDSPRESTRDAQDHDIETASRFFS
jgi:hypothetical protein